MLIIRQSTRPQPLLTSMFASRSLFQTAIPIGNPPRQGETGISKSRPFLNTWANSQAATAPLSNYPDEIDLKNDKRREKQHRRQKHSMASITDVYGFVPKDSKNQPYPLSQHRGKVLLLVNVASKCGFTPQYTALESLYKKYAPQGLVILGFPCNQFMNQDPGSNDEIQSFCRMNYGVTFPVLAKVDVNGDKEEPVFGYIKDVKKSLGMKRVKWNFEKWLVGRDGKVVERWGSNTKPESLEGAIEKELAKGVGAGEGAGMDPKAEL